MALHTEGQALGVRDRGELARVITEVVNRPDILPKPANFRRERWGTAAPTTGTWKVGDVTWNTVPASAGFIGWVCTVAGTPGTWKTWGLIS